MTEKKLTPPSLRNTDRVRTPDLELAKDPQLRENAPELMRAGQWYLADSDELSELHLRGYRLSQQFIKAYGEDPAKAQEIIRELVGDMGQNTFVRPPFTVDYGSQVSLGDNVFINFNCSILDICTVRIGNNSQIGPNVQMLGPVHPVDPEARKTLLEAGDPIEIGENVWVGGGAIILAGVKIGDNTVIGAGAVVTKDMPAGVIVGGNPARIIGEAK